MAAIVTPIRITLKDARENAELTQTELAKLAGVHQRVISEMETGKTKQVRLETFERLCRALELEPGDLLELDPPARKRRR
jgi:putative transcriptional regulator